MSRLTSDLFELTELAPPRAGGSVHLLVTIVGALAVMFTLRWELALVLLVLLPVLLTMALRRRRQMSAASQAARSRPAPSTPPSSPACPACGPPRPLPAKKPSSSGSTGANEVFKTAKRGFLQEMGRFNAVMEFCTGILPVAVIAVGGWLITGGKWTMWI